MRKKHAGQLFAPCRDHLHVGGCHCLEVCRVVPDGGIGDKVGHRHGNPFVWHAEVCVDHALQPTGGGCGVKPGSCGVLGSPVDDIEAAPQAGSGEVAGYGRELSPAGVAGDDVVDVVDVRGVGSLSARVPGRSDRGCRRSRHR